MDMHEMPNKKQKNKVLRHIASLKRVPATIGTQRLNCTNKSV
jgi:hypothetical protein